jgi:hypothetical protein
MLRAQGLCKFTTANTTLSCSAITSMTWQHRRQHNSTSTSRRNQVASAALSPAWLRSIVTSMTRHLHCIVAKLPQQCHRHHNSATSSPAWLDIYIVPWPSHLGSTVASMTRQHYCHHDSASTSCHDQVASAALSLACLGGAIVSMTWHRHHTTAWSWTSTMTYVLSGKQTHCQLILIY